MDNLALLSGQKGGLYEEKAEMLIFINGIFILKSYFSGLVAVTSGVRSFLARGLMQ